MIPTRMPGNFFSLEQLRDQYQPQQAQQQQQQVNENNNNNNNSSNSNQQQQQISPPSQQQQEINQPTNSQQPHQPLSFFDTLRQMQQQIQQQQQFSSLSARFSNPNINNNNVQFNTVLPQQQQEQQQQQSSASLQNLSQPIVNSRSSTILSNLPQSLLNPLYTAYNQTNLNHQQQDSNTQENSKNQQQPSQQPFFGGNLNLSNNNNNNINTSFNSQLYCTTSSSLQQQQQNDIPANSSSFLSSSFNLSPSSSSNMNMTQLQPLQQDSSSSPNNILAQTPNGNSTPSSSARKSPTNIITMADNKPLNYISESAGSSIVHSTNSTSKKHRTSEDNNSYQQDQHDSQDINQNDEENANPQQQPKGNLSRHVASVVSHFTYDPEGYKRLLNELDDFIHVLSPSGQFLYCSPGIRKLLGYRPDEWIGKQVVELIHQDDRLHVMEKLSQACSNHEQFLMYCRYKTKAQEFALLEIKCNPVVSERGNEVKYLIQTGREYRSKGSLSLDSMLKLRLDHLKLRRALERILKERGFDPKSHPLLSENAASTSANIPLAFTSLDDQLDSASMVSGNTSQFQSHAEKQNDTSSQTGSDFLPALLNSMSEAYMDLSGAGPSVMGLPSGGSASSLLPNMQFGNNPSTCNSVIPMLGNIAPPNINTNLKKGINPTQPSSTTKKKKHKIPDEELFCRQCGTTSSPEWRRGPDGPKTLCNACGLAHSKKQRKLKGGNTNTSTTTQPKTHPS